jgi:hypothetical protein
LRRAQGLLQRVGKCAHCRFALAFSATCGSRQAAHNAFDAQTAHNLDDVGGVLSCSGALAHTMRPSELAALI